MYLLKPTLNMFFRKFANCKIRFWMGYWVFMAKREKNIYIFDTMHLSLQIIVVLVISPEEIRGNSSHPVQCRPDSYFKSSRLSVNIKCLSMLPTITDFLKNIWLCFLAWSSLCQHRKPNPPGFYDLTDKVTWILFPISGWAILYSSGKPKLNLWNYNNGSRRNISP